MATRMKRVTLSDSKRRQAEQSRKTRLKIVNLRDQIDRWKQIREENGLQHDGEVAKILIDSFLQTHAAPALSQPPTSSPGPIRTERHRLVSALGATLTTLPSEESSVTGGSDANKHNSVLSETPGPSGAKRKATPDENESQKYLKKDLSSSTPVTEEMTAAERSSTDMKPVFGIDLAKQHSDEEPCDITNTRTASDKVIGDNTERDQPNLSQANRSRAVRSSQPENLRCTRLVAFQSIYGLPVNRPFILRYSSPTLHRLVDSKVYLTAELSEAAHNQVKPMIIEVKGHINETEPTSLNSKAVQDASSSSCSNMQNLADITNTIVNSTPQTQVGDSSFDIAKTERTESSISEAIPDKIEETGNGLEVVSGILNTDITNTIVNSTPQTQVGDSSFDIAKTERTESSISEAIPDKIEETGNGLEVVSGILNDVIDSVVKRYKIHPDYGTKKSILCNRKDDDFLYNTSKRKRLLMLENSVDTDMPYSSRMRSKGYRIDYSYFNELDNVSENSDLDDMILDSDDETDGTSESDKNTANMSSRGSNARKEDDPDFIPDDLKELEHTDYSSAKKDKINNLENEMNIDNGINTDNEVNKDIAMEKKKRLIEKAIERKSLKKLDEEKKRIKVQLGEHEDKYYTENQVSVEMKHRGKKDAEKTFKLLVCRLCEKFRTENKLVMENHLELHLNGDLTCKKCDFTGITKEQMHAHGRKHPKFNKRCFICCEKFDTEKLHQTHLSSVHGLLPWLCTVCTTKENPVSFEDEKTYENHFIESHQDHMLKCSFCEGYFCEKKSLRNHRCTGKEKVNATCDICGKVLRLTALRMHINSVHFNVRPYPCPYCKYAGKNRTALADHINAKHEDIHKHKCDQCDFTCARSFQLTSHKRTHTGYKPYKCDKCPYTAAWNVQLKDHKKLHGSGLGVECEKCGITVRKGAPYTRHLKKDHSEDSSETTKPGPSRGKSNKRKKLV